MGNPKTIYLPDDEGDYPRSDGISIEYIKRRQTLCISGWYDRMVGIPGGELTIAEFLDRLGITDSDIRKSRETQP